MSEYPKIETLYERDMDTFKVKPGVFRNPVYNLLKTWHWTEKINGTNIRCIWNPQLTTENLIFHGRTDAAEIHKDLMAHLQNTVLSAKLFEVFSANQVVIYGEGYGAGIQKGGGDYSPTKKFIVFDILVDGKWWLSYKDMVDVVNKLGLDVVPSFGETSLEEATEYVRMGFLSRIAINPNKKAEGLVGRPAETLFDKRGNRLIVKLKTKDFV